MIYGILASCAARDVKPIMGDSATNSSSKFGNADDGFGAGISDGTEVEIDYPKIQYRGQGRIETRADTSNIYQTIDVEMDKDQVKFTTSNTRSDSGNSDVRDGVRSADGLQLFKRTSPDKLKKMQETQGFPETNMFIFVDSIRKTNGQENFFDPPLPLTIIPKSKSNYEEFRRTGTTSYRSQVSGATNASVMVTISPGSTVTSQMESILVRYDIEGISRDRGKRQLGDSYSSFGLPENIEFIIDTKLRRVTQMRNISTFFEENNDSWPINQMNFNICRFETFTSGVETIPCN